MWKPRLDFRSLTVRDRRLWILAVAVLVIALAYAASFMIDEPLRRSIERRMNARLKGYTVHLGGASFHPHGFSLDLLNLTVVQDANPDPPVMKIARLGASVQWRELIRAKLVANMVIDRPSLYVNLAHLKQEAKEEVPVKERGWQDALQEAYPLTLNELQIVNGDITYVDPAKPFKPLRLTKLYVDADNIRNIKSKEREYPSELHLRAVVFDTGRLRIDGHADFLAEPYPGLTGRVSLDQMQMEYFQPVTRRYNVELTGGVLSVVGEFEYAPSFKSVVVENVTVRGAHVEYINSPQSQTASSAAKAGQEATDQPDIDLAIQRLDILGSTLGYVNQTRNPPYRVFFTDTDLHLTGLTNESTEAPARLTARGKFMGSGATQATLAFRPRQKGGDMNLKVSIEKTDMMKMNELLQSYGKFEVTGGDFSLYSEINVRDGAINGYVKPLFKGITVANSPRSSEKTFGQKLKEHLVAGAAKLLKNRPRHEVATKADLSGRLDDPQTSIMQIVGKLVQNAFFKAILPGFERSAASTPSPPPRSAERAPASNRSG
ncbi:MAG TPA: DUF748 domain-containing protein [Methylomirabilota bacterium]|nr:DUF748 domain-containing protein [Methylomirabilota bacterium]